MNYSIIRFVLGWIMKVEGMFFILPILTAVIYKEKAGLSFLVVAVISVLLGTVLSLKKPEDKSFYAREGFITVALGWIVMSLIGALPFYLSGEIPSYLDAFFEIVSGFTTTGASILSDVEALSKCMLIWRSFSHWLGGMGVLVFVLTILPLTGGESIHLLKAESPGPSVSKLVPKMRYTTGILYLIYTVMMLVQIVLLLIGKMPLFDALCMSFGSAGTGGFSILNTGCATYTTYQQAVITIFMFLFGVNFSFYFLLLMKKGKEAFSIEEVKWYFILFLGVSLLITWNVSVAQGGNPLMNFHHAAFTVSSIMTTTGYATVDFNLWPSFSKALIVMIMFIGACAGSTGGGIKVSRIVIYIKSIKREFAALLHPRSVKVLKMDGKKVENTVLRSALVFLCAYVVIYAASLIIISLDNFDFETNFTAVAATLNNIGPGLAGVGPTSNFGSYSPLSKIVLCFDMLAGRLELFPMLLLFIPSAWRRKN